MIRTRLVTALNLLALPLAFFAALREVIAFPGAMAWYEFIPCVGAMGFLIALPAIATLSVIHEGASERVRSFVTMFNLLFCVIAGACVYSLLRGSTVEAKGIFCIGLSPVALASALYLVLERD